MVKPEKSKRLSWGLMVSAFLGAFGLVSLSLGVILQVVVLVIRVLDVQAPGEMSGRMYGIVLTCSGFAFLIASMVTFWLFYQKRSNSE